MEANVTILEDMVRSARVSVIRKEYLTDALENGPEVYYKGILKHEISNPMTKWDVLILLYITCSLLNDLSLRICTEALTIDRTEKFNDLLLELVVSGRSWVETMCNNPQFEQIDDITDLEFNAAKETALKRADLTQSLLIAPLVAVKEYIEEYGMEDEVPGFPCIQIQLDKFNEFYPIIKEGRLEKKLVVPELNKPTITLGFEAYWFHRFGEPMRSTPGDLMAGMIVFENIITDTSLHLVECMTAMLQIEDDRCHEDLINQMSTLVNALKEYRSIAIMMDIHTDRPDGLPKLKAMTRLCRDRIIPELQKVSDVISKQASLDGCFPANQHVGRIIREFETWFPRFMNT